MTIFIVCAVIAVIVAVFFAITEDDLVFFILLFPGLLCAVVIGLILNMIISPIVGYHPVFSRQNLVALTDERTSTGGSFFLGSGYVGSSAAYTFYVDNGGYKTLHQVDAPGLPVFEDSEQPYVVWNNGDVSDHPAITFSMGKGGTTIAELHVPKGSIKTGIVMGVPK